ncbi:NusG domain II-containing protein [bacterium]|nr:NusG domain II-containing protein [bacterium]
MRFEIGIPSRPRLADGILFVLLISLTVFSPRFLPAGSVGELLTVRTPDSITEISLDVDGRYPVSGPLGTAFLVVQKGRAHLENAPCPLKICEAMGSIDRSGQVIVCLPNRIVIKVSGPEEVDAVSR